MIIASRTVPLGLSQKLVIVPLSDLHHNAPGHDRGKFLEIIEWVRTAAKRRDRVMGVLLMGDYLDTFSGSERRALASAGLHESSRAVIEKLMRQHIGDLLADLRPIAKQVWGVVEGNHTYKFQEADVSGSDVGKTVSRFLAEQLGVPYFGMCGCLVVSLSRVGSNSSMPLKVLMHHGFGVASSKSASIMQMTKLRERFPNMDLYVMGHCHVPIATVIQGIDVRMNRKTGSWRMVERDQAFVRAGSFLKGYIEGQAVDGYSGSYVEEKCLVPQGLGVVTCNVRWKTKRAPHAPVGKKRSGTVVDGISLHTQE